MSEDQALDAILALVRERTGLDFHSYRRPTIARRVRNRMASVGAQAFAAYHALLEGSEPETAALLERLTIKVSRFYRNAPAFDLVRQSVLPALAQARPGQAISIWCAGCGRGEEAHTFAMLLEEYGLAGEVLATDIDGAALEFAARGTYGEAALQELPADLRDRFVDAVPGNPAQWRVRDAVRGRVRWVREDASACAPATRHDLVSCRNVLIYLDRAAQQGMLARLVDALAPGGYLLLGEAEWPSAEVLPQLTTLAARARLFRASAMQELAA